jgi:hypothetical protein
LHSLYVCVESSRHRGTSIGRRIRCGRCRPAMVIVGRRPSSACKSTIQDGVARCLIPGFDGVIWSCRGLVPLL